MDAKILRAAVSAAIRVTVSTSLLGCGAHTTSNDVENGAGARTSPPRDESEYSSASAGGSRSRHDLEDEYVATSGSSGAASAGGVSTGGATSVSEGGGGLASAAGTAGQGAGGSGDLPLDISCPAMTECVAQLEALPLSFQDPLPASASLCCQTVLQGLASSFMSSEKPVECYNDVWSRFMGAAAHGACCVALDAWQQQACTPWGPAVPPELSRDALLALEAAA